MQFATEFYQSSEMGLYQDSKSAAASFAYHQSTSAHFEYFVEGDLNEDEQAAISDLIAQVETVANHFFKGDIDAAFNTAMSVKKDTSLIDNFRLDLGQSIQNRAIRAYQSVEQLPTVLANIDTLDDWLSLVDALKEQLLENIHQTIDTAKPALVPAELIKLTKALLDDIFSKPQETADNSSISA